MNKKTTKSNSLCRRCLLRDKRIQKLKLQLLNLQNKHDEVVSHPMLRAGLQGEDLIVRLAKGRKSKNGASFDLKLRNGDRVEVKYSKPTIPAPGYPCRRWVWNRVFGNKRMKRYEYLVLIGEKPESDEEGQASNKKRLVYFLLKKSEVNKVVAPGNKTGLINLVLTKKTRSKQGLNLWEYQKNLKEMKSFFNNIIIDQKHIAA